MAVRYLSTRYVFYLVAAVLLWLVIPFEPSVKVVITAILVAPMAAMAPGFTDEAGLDVGVSTFMTTVTVLVAVVAMPALLIALG